MHNGVGQSFVSLICSFFFLLLDALVASLLFSPSLHALHNRFSMCRYLFYLSIFSYSSRSSADKNE